MVEVLDTVVLEVMWLDMMVLCCKDLEVAWLDIETLLNVG